jgi:hypothetical protein
MYTVSVFLRGHLVVTVNNCPGIDALAAISQVEKRYNPKLDKLYCYEAKRQIELN